MKQIHKAVQALESDIGFWRPCLILLKKVKNAEKKATILQIFRNNPSWGVWLYYQILMMAKMSKTKISTKIQKRKKNLSFYYQNHTKSFEAIEAAIEYIIRMTINTKPALYPPKIKLLYVCTVCI